MNALSIRDLVKVYDNDVRALNGINLEVPAGDFFALLGPNGAGKSTAIGVISSLINKSSGTVEVFGSDIDTDQATAKASIGLVPQESNFNVFEPIINVITNVAGYNGIGQRLALQRAERYLRLLDLWDKRRSTARQLSGGMKRRLMIARALVHEPRLLILDEPTAGVDIEIRRSMWEFLTELNEQHGTTIILTTHYLEEAEALCRNVAIINHGDIIEQGNVSQLLGRAMLETFVLTVSGELPPVIDIAPFIARIRSDGQLEVDVPKGHNINDLFVLLGNQGVEVSSMRNKANRLEAFFLRLVSQPAEAGT